MGIKLNIGSGKDIKPGYVNIDIGEYGQQITRDIENNYLPFDDCSVDEIQAESFLEHIDNLFFVLDECWRVLKPSGSLIVVVPDGVSIAPDHKRYFNKKFFDTYITTGPKRYSFTDKHWKLVKYSDDPVIHATLTPIKKNERAKGDKLNLGSGSLHKKDFINTDIVKPCDKIIDVTKGIPFEDDRFDRIEANNLLEHLDNTEFMRIMNEVHRVLKKDGEFWFRVPDALHWADGAYGDPTHKRFFVPRSFNYFTQTSTYRNYGKSYGFKEWRQLSLKGDDKFFEWTGSPVKQ